jgi:predicted transposase/invertase (TIGR01784 family)
MQELRDRYIDSLNSYRDLQNSLDTAKAEGKAEGKVEERFEIVRNGLRAGLPVEIISQITGLSAEEIEALK